MNLKPRSVFQKISFMDQENIFELCEMHPYHRVVDIIARPREQGGMGIQTSISSLRRFYIAFNPETEKLRTLGQFAESCQILKQEQRGSFHSALAAMAEAQLLKALKEGKPLAELQTEVRLTTALQRTALAAEKWRTNNIIASKLESDRFGYDSKQPETLHLAPEDRLPGYNDELDEPAETEKNQQIEAQKPHIPENSSTNEPANPERSNTTSNPEASTQSTPAPEKTMYEAMQDVIQAELEKVRTKLRAYTPEQLRSWGFDPEDIECIINGVTRI